MRSINKLFNAEQIRDWCQSNIVNLASPGYNALSGGKVTKPSALVQLWDDGVDMKTVNQPGLCCLSPLGEWEENWILIFKCSLSGEVRSGSRYIRKLYKISQHLTAASHHWIHISLFQTELNTTIPPAFSTRVFSLINISPISSRKISNINKKFSARSNLFSRLQRRGRRGTKILKSLVLTVCF